jgi:ubiquinone/menaquinone biosynthesis C-methylase UbiE
VFEAAGAYDRFMGRYSTALAPQLADLAGVADGQSVLDVGCGPGALTGELVRRVGAERVAAVDPSGPFVSAARERHPGVDVRQAAAEELPFADGSFDAALAQLVVHFMADAGAGLREMRRVTRPGGAVAACVWDQGGGRTPLAAFWRAAKEIDPQARDESALIGVREGQLAELLTEAGLRDVAAAELPVAVAHDSFEEWWEPFTLGVGPAGAYLNDAGAERRDRIRDRCRELLGDPPIRMPAVAWAAVGRA